MKKEIEMQHLAIAYQIVILSGLIFGAITAFRFKQKSNGWILVCYVVADLLISAYIVYTGKV